MSDIIYSESFRIFVATWNVAGKSPHDGLNLDGFLSINDRSDIYVLGFQEIVPLNAGNVLVMEDNEPASKWLSLINRTLNKSESVDTPNGLTNTSDHLASLSSQALSTRALLSPKDIKSCSTIHVQKPSLKAVSLNFTTERSRQFKTCNCPLEAGKKNKQACFSCQQRYKREVGNSSDDDGSPSHFTVRTDTATANAPGKNRQNYNLIVSKQMVGIFISIWVRKELVHHVGHLRLCCVGRGIMGCLGNKGCISVSMSLHQTTFCFICSHLTSGEKEGDEIRRNSDVIEILKNTQFPNICKAAGRGIPEKILEHDRVIWLGDLNYRIALSYSETRKLLEENAWDALLEKDQLKIEQEAGRVFKGWKEGKIYFAPTYKYSNNSDAYAAETTTRRKRRTPAWCDRILWHGDGIEQLCYIRGESRFSDHRPVYAVFMANVRVTEPESNQRLSSSDIKVEIEEFLPLDVEVLLPTNGRYLALKTMY